MHVIVVMHGMWGTTNHMNEIVQTIQMKYPQSILYNCPVNTFFYTFQGIDICGLRLKQDLQQFLSNWKKDHDGSSEDEINSISFIGYSAGGLFNRYCVGLLFQENFFQTIKPIHFITIATPHLGIRNNSRISSGRMMNILGDNIVTLYAGRTGQQLALVDGNERRTNGEGGENQLLLEMSLPDSVFYKGLALFSHIYIYSNGRADNTVPFCTSSLSQTNKYKEASTVPPPSPIDSTILTDETKPSIDSDPSEENSSSPLSSSSSRLLLSPRYNFIVTQERIDSDQSIIPESKPIEYDFFQTGKYLFLLILFSPVLLLHCFIFLVAFRIPSLCFPLPKNYQEELIPISLPVKGLVPKDSCPLLILRHLRCLPIYRVVAMLPGPHTHGTIICRSWKTNGGMEVITHLVEDVLSLSLIEKQCHDDFQQKLENRMVHN
jgi:hypothetical protein